MTSTHPLDTVTAELSALNPQPSANPRRNGKIARLPRETRDMINRMLDDGLPYPVIIDELGEAGEGLNAQNLTNWKQGGYQDYLKVQALIEKIKAQTETAMDILRQTGDIDISKLKKACDQVAAIQLFTFLRQHGDASLRNMVAANPAKFLSILNIVCRLSGSALEHEKFNHLIRQIHQTTPELDSHKTTPSEEASR